MAKVENLNQLDWAAEFLHRPLIARLATCSPETLQPHVVPVWYEWDGDCIWISSFRSTRKIGEIRRNPRVSLVVDTDPNGDGGGHTVIFEGPAELLEDPAQGVERGYHIYARYLGPEGALAPEPQSWLHDPEHLLIKIIPVTIYAS
jgi:nitroimidazol reductase NimA-like FMN-containing flavoprotein (pyridoxamine 5'-phosphate oxidase superfamily)